MTGRRFAVTGLDGNAHLPMVCANAGRRLRTCRPVVGGLSATDGRHVTARFRPCARRQPLGDPATLQQDDGQWVVTAKNYASTRFSGLDEINAQTVGRLGVSWTFSTGMVAGHEAAPLVVGGAILQW